MLFQEGFTALKSFKLGTAAFFVWLLYNIIRTAKKNKTWKITKVTEIPSLSITTCHKHNQFNGLVWKHQHCTANCKIYT